jgi:anti-sigma factor RsiW
VSCSEQAPATLETIAAWCLGELDAPAAERFEEHYFSCASCFERARRMQDLVEQLRASLPPILTADRRRALEGSQPVRAVRVAAGGRASLHMSASAPLGIWVMQAPLAEVTRVDFEARTAQGALMFALGDVPFDVQRGEVVLACQLHYRALGLDQEMHVRLTGTSSSGRHAIADYILDHRFDDGVSEGG